MTTHFRVRRAMALSTALLECDRPNAAPHAKAGAVNGVDYQGFPYDLSSGS